jgi:hypothetical protein
MRSFGLFNMAYGTTGITSANLIQSAEGMLVSLWVILVGGAFFLGLVPQLRTMAAALRARIARSRKA